VLLGKYRVEQILGHGGMGVVAEATHLALGEKVAIKFLRTDVVVDDETCARFLREAQAAVKLKSEHVARVSDVGMLAGGAPYMVMEFLEGVDLDQMIASSGAVDPPLAVELVLQGCEALAEAHAYGIVHRDLKPSNFFVTWRPDGSPLVKVLDFGISKAPVGVDLSLTQTQSVLGTPAYMSPEQMRSARKVDGRTDIWSLGTVLYELIEGRRPYDAESFSEMCVKVAADPPEPMRSRLPAGLAAAIARCLEKDPAKRFQTMGELATAIAPFSRDIREAQLRVERIRRVVSRPRSAELVQSINAREQLSGAGLAVAPVAFAPGGAAAVDAPVRRTPWPTSTVNERGAPEAVRIARRRRLVIGMSALLALLVGGLVIGLAIGKETRTEEDTAAGAGAAAATGSAAAAATDTAAAAAPATATAPATDAGSAPAPAPVAAPAAATDADAEAEAVTATATVKKKPPRKKVAKRPAAKKPVAKKPAVTKPAAGDDVFGKRK
jgi:eukaryotic-like serine/threonine-protein kinase